MFPNLVTYHIHKNKPLPANNALAYQYILAGNGVFIRNNGPHVPRLRGDRFFTGAGSFFSALVTVKRCTIRGLAPLKPQFCLHVPKLPSTLLQSILTDAKCSCAPRNKQILHEALYHFHHLGHTVRVKKRPQQATVTTVQTEGDGGTDVICDLHSHGRMPPFWSDTDNRDELGSRLYAVIGRVDSDQPEIKLRVGVYGHWLPLPITAVFTDRGSSGTLRASPFKDLYLKEK